VIAGPAILGTLTPADYYQAAGAIGRKLDRVAIAFRAANLKLAVTDHRNAGLDLAGLADSRLNGFLRSFAVSHHF
jgi:hypothetical protein